MLGLQEIVIGRFHVPDYRLGLPAVQGLGRPKLVPALPHLGMDPAEVPDGLGQGHRQQVVVGILIPRDEKITKDAVSHRVGIGGLECGQVPRTGGSHLRLRKKDALLRRLEGRAAKKGLSDGIAQGDGLSVGGDGRHIRGRLRIGQLPGRGRREQQGQKNDDI